MGKNEVNQELEQIKAQLALEWSQLIKRNANEADMEVWRQSVRERYPEDCNTLLVAVREFMEVSEAHKNEINGVNTYF